MTSQELAVCAECAAVLRAMVKPLRDQLSERGLTHGQLAIQIGVSRPTISRALSGNVVPSKPVIYQIAITLNADLERALRRRQHAEHILRKFVQQQHYLAKERAPVAWDAHGLRNALRQLMRQHGVSQLTVSQVATIPTSTISAALCGHRIMTREVIHAILNTCGITGLTMDAWDRVWQQVCEPSQRAALRRRWHGYTRRWYAQHCTPTSRAYRKAAD